MKCRENVKNEGFVLIRYCYKISIIKKQNDLDNPHN